MYQLIEQNLGRCASANSTICADISEDLTKALLIYKTHELSIEKIIQLIIQVTLVLLSLEYTEFPTKSGFQALFDPQPHGDSPYF